MLTEASEEPMKKVVKTRVARECSCCDNIIAKGSNVVYEEGRVPDYDEVTAGRPREQQNGIIYFRAWFCNQCLPLQVELFEKR